MYDSFRIDEDPQELGVTLQELEAAPFGFDRPLPGGDPRNWRQFPSDSIVFGFDRPAPGAALCELDRHPPGLDPEEFYFLLKLWEEGRYHPPLPGGDPEEFLFQLELYAEFLFHMDLLEANPAGLGVPEIIYSDNYILFDSCNNRQDPCSRFDGFRSMPAARDSANSSGYGGAADKGMTMVQITNLPEQVTSKHELYELFRTFGSVIHVDILRPGGIGFVNFIKSEDAVRAINQLNGWCGARLMLVKPGPEQGLQYGQKMVKPGDALESGRGWIRDTARRSWQKPLEDTLARGQDLMRHTSKSEQGPPFWRKPIRDHQCRSTENGENQLETISANQTENGQTETDLSLAMADHIGSLNFL